MAPRGGDFGVSPGPDTYRYMYGMQVTADKRSCYIRLILPGFLELLHLLSVSYTLGPSLGACFWPSSAAVGSSSYAVISWRQLVFPWSLYLTLGLGFPLLPLAARAVAGHNTILNHEETVLMPAILR